MLAGTPDEVLDRLLSRMAALAPQFDLTAEDVRGWGARMRPGLLALLAEKMGQPQSFRPAPPDEWTASKRTEANLAAMRVLAQLVKAGRRPTSEETDELARYSGWGGLSIEKNAAAFPAGIPHPESAGLIHEYFTPSRVAEAVSGLVLSRVETLPAHSDGIVRALEPSAGIGRFLRYLHSPKVAWEAVELSPLSGLLLGNLYPDLDLHLGSFESWAAANAADRAGKLGLVVANPPYGARGAERVDDPDRDYSGHRRSIYHYFMRRVMDLMARGGLGVWLVPMGWMHARTGPTAELRQTMLLRHHVAAAFRLPSTLFPGANIVTDLIMLRARGGELPGILAADEYIADGRYFEAHPTHVLGTVVGAAADDDSGKIGRRWMRIEGDFTGFPDFAERKLDDRTAVAPFVIGGKRKKARGGIARAESGDADLSGLADWLAAAIRLGGRVDRWLADVGAGQETRARAAHAELTAALTAWVKTWGVPLTNKALRKAEADHPMLTRFLAAYGADGRLSPAIANAPSLTSRWTGSSQDVVGQASAYYRDHQTLDVDAFVTHHRGLGGSGTASQVVGKLRQAGWCHPYEEPGGDRRLVPPEHYYYGSLWPKLDAAEAVIAASPGVTLSAAHVQASKLREAIAPLQYEDIAHPSPGVSGMDPRMGSVPLDLLAEWMGSKNADYELRFRFELYRADGLLQIKGIAYSDLSVSDAGGGYGYGGDVDSVRDLPRWVVECIGWYNHDYSLWKPRKSKEEDIHAKRAEWQADALLHFAAWSSATDDRRERIAHAYNRQMLGYRVKTYPAEPLPIARWHYGPRTTPHPWQLVGARRVLDRRGGLVAFDVGVGKTLTGLLVLAMARQEGWARRPVLLVPRSLLWKWEADVRNCLPDYSCIVIGSSRGKRRGGGDTTRTDSVEVQAGKWTAFQAGLHDVAICSYESFGRIQVKAASLREYAASTESVLREVKLKQDALKDQEKRGKKELTERERAVLTHGVQGWLAEKLEPPKGQPYLPGITWEDVGVDLLIVDELQNFKNLYMPQPRGAAGVPKFMGSGGEGSNRAWSLDFRAALVRKRTGGAGIVGLSATPAKNSPLEFYNVLQYIDHDAWKRAGIPDPESFIDRFIKIELQYVIQSDGKVEQRNAAAAFQNLHEIRAVLDRYAQFETAESVSKAYPDRALVLPEPVSAPVYVDMDERQTDEYEQLRSEANRIRNEMRGGGGPGAARALAGELLGVMARMALVSLHPSLGGGDWTWKTAKNLAPALQVAAKFVAVGKRIKGQPGCGHIVLMESVPAHVWLRDTLLREKIIAPGRIAVLNAAAVPDSGTRVTIADDFNGSETSPPKYDVVIANSVAYEGIDLQRRTCQIHHLDLPWEPATIQQRNGRGVRQGNTLDVIGISYYLAKGSFDAIRYQMIQKKRGWMVTLIESQDRVTNNPGAQAEMSGAEIAALLSSDPEEARKLIDEAKLEIEQRKRKVAIATANDLLRSINGRLRAAEKSGATPDEVRRLRGEAKLNRDKLASIDPEVWPWAVYAMRRVEAQAPFITRAKNANVDWPVPPLFDGVRFRVRTTGGPMYFEAGRLDKGGLGIWIRPHGRFEPVSVDLDGKGGWPPAAIVAPDDVETRDYDSGKDLDEVLQALQTSYSPPDPSPLQTWALESADALWARWAPSWMEKARNRGRVWMAGYSNPMFPLVTVAGQLRLVRESGLSGGVVLAPTETGWARFIELAPALSAAQGTTYTDFANVARGWFGKTFPTGILPSKG